MTPFQLLRKSTHCPFAKQSKVIEIKKFDLIGRNRESEMECVSRLRDFTSIAVSEKYHGAAIEIKVGSDAFSLEMVRIRFREFLMMLASHDECARNSLGNFEAAPGWQFSFSGIRFFLNVFAPFYPINHSKFIPLDDSFLIFFQPENSFDYCGINRKNKKIKREIRDLFKTAGSEYNGELIDKRIEPLLYIFPICIFDAPVIWWE